MSISHAVCIGTIVSILSLAVIDSWAQAQVPLKGSTDRKQVSSDSVAALLKQLDELERELVEAECEYTEFLRQSKILGDLTAPERRLKQIDAKKMELTLERAHVSAMLKTLQARREKDEALRPMIILIKRTDPAFRELNLDENSHKEFLDTYVRSLSSQLVMLDALADELDRITTIQEKEWQEHTIFIFQYEGHRDRIERKSRLYDVLLEVTKNAMHADR